jgi:hypothetical protein
MMVAPQTFADIYMKHNVVKGVVELKVISTFSKRYTLEDHRYKYIHCKDTTLKFVI